MMTADMVPIEWTIVITDTSGAAIEFAFPDQHNMMNVVSILESAMNGDQRIAKYQYEGSCYVISSLNIVSFSYPNPV
jgi:hypothetical protein